jgi:hypothetical protein
LTNPIIFSSNQNLQEPNQILLHQVLQLDYGQSLIFLKEYYYCYLLSCLNLICLHSFTTFFYLFSFSHIFFLYFKFSFLINSILNYHSIPLNSLYPNSHFSPTLPCLLNLPYLKISLYSPKILISNIYLLLNLFLLKIIPLHFLFSIIIRLHPFIKINFQL